MITVTCSNRYEFENVQTAKQENYHIKQNTEFGLLL